MPLKISHNVLDAVMSADAAGVAHNIINEAIHWGIFRYDVDPVSTISDAFMSYIAQYDTGGAYSDDTGTIDDYSDVPEPQSVTKANILSAAMSKFVGRLFDDFSHGADRIREVSELKEFIFEAV